MSTANYSPTTGTDSNRAMDPAVASDRPTLGEDSASTPTGTASSSPAPTTEATAPSSPPAPPPEATVSVGEAQRNGEPLAADETEWPQPLAADALSATAAPVCLRLSFIDFAGDPIAGLPVRIEVNGVGRTCVTDSNGHCPQQSDLLPESVLEIFVKKDDGSWVSKHVGRVLHGDTVMCGVSPTIKIPIVTEEHRGPRADSKIAPALAARPKVPPPAQPLRPNPPPKGTPTSGGRVPCKVAQPGQNDQGHPTARLRDHFVDWAGRIGIPTFGLWQWSDFKSRSGPTHPIVCGPAPNATGHAEQGKSPSVSGTHAHKVGRRPPPEPVVPAQARAAAVTAETRAVSRIDQPAPPALLALIEIMEEQATWDWLKPPLTGTSANILASLIKQTFETPVLKGANEPRRRCYKSVKVGLKRAN